MILSSSTLSSLIVLLLILLLIVIICVDCTGPPGSVPMKIVNYAGKPLELFWIDANSGKRDKTGIYIIFIFIVLSFINNIIFRKR